MVSAGMQPAVLGDMNTHMKTTNTDVWHDRLIDRGTEHLPALDATGYLALALAALDQAGLSVATQRAVADLVTRDPRCPPAT